VRLQFLLETRFLTVLTIKALNPSASSLHCRAPLAGLDETCARSRKLCALLSLLVFATGCAYYPKIGGAAKPIPYDAVEGEWKKPQFKIDVRCERVKSAIPQYRLSDARFWSRLWRLSGPDRYLRIYKIRNQLWYETFAEPENPQTGANSVDESVEVGVFRLQGQTTLYLRHLDPYWVYDYAVKHPKLLPYAEIPRKPNDLFTNIIVTASPKRWYWFLENETRYPKSFTEPEIYYRVR